MYISSWGAPYEICSICLIKTQCPAYNRQTQPPGSGGQPALEVPRHRGRRHAPRLVQRGRAPPVLDPGVRAPLLHQQPHRLEVALGGRDVEGGAPVPVAAVDAHPRPQQAAQQGDVAREDGGAQAGGVLDRVRRQPARARVCVGVGGGREGVKGAGLSRDLYDPVPSKSRQVACRNIKQTGFPSQAPGSSSRPHLAP